MSVVSEVELPKTCKACGKAICWGVDDHGVKIMLDPKEPVYRMDGNFIAGMAHIVRDTMALVPHFATCRTADRFDRLVGGRGSDLADKFKRKDK